MFFDRPPVALGVTVMSLLLIWRHSRNIVNLLKGKEPKLGVKPVDDPKRKRRRRVRRLHEDSVRDTHSPSQSSSQIQKGK